MIRISPKAFFFDFDGVICDSEQAHMFATMAVIAKHAISFTEDYYFEKLFGFDDKGLFEHLFRVNKKRLDQKTLKELIRAKNAAFMKLIDTHIVHIDGVNELIMRLEANKIPMAVVSGALKKEVAACLDKARLTRHFQFLVCADMVKNSKPDPESYELTYEEMKKIVPDLRRENCWVLEDSPTGIASAKGAGLNTIAITNTTTRENLSEADYVVDGYEEIVIFANI